MDETIFKKYHTINEGMFELLTCSFNWSKLNCTFRSTMRDAVKQLRLG